MQKDDRVRLLHMMDAAREAVRFARGRTCRDLDADRLLKWGLVKALEIVGEAVRQVSEETCEQFPQIP